MEDNTKGNGKIIKWMVMVSLNGQMGKFMRDNIQRIKNMVKEHLFGLMERTTLENGIKECNMDKGNS